MGIFGFGESKREKVRKIREKESKRLLKHRRKQRGREAEERELGGKTSLLRKKVTYHKAKRQLREAKYGKGDTSFPEISLPKKKKQGKKLSRRRGIRLI